MGRTSKGKQIRVWIDKESYDNVKNKAKQLGLTIEHYSGLVLSGFQISKQELA